VLLKPQSEWRTGLTKEKLVAEMDKAMQIVGYVNMWVQPISARIVMQDTGIQTPVGIKVKGADVDTIETLGQQIEAMLKPYPGTQSVIAERISSKKERGDLLVGDDAGESDMNEGLASYFASCASRFRAPRRIPSIA